MYEELLNDDDFLNNVVKTCYVAIYSYGSVVLGEEEGEGNWPWMQAPPGYLEQIKSAVRNIVILASLHKEDLKDKSFIARVKFLAESNHENWLTRTQMEGRPYHGVFTKNGKISVAYSTLPKESRVQNELVISMVLQLIEGEVPITSVTKQLVIS